MLNLEPLNINWTKIIQVIVTTDRRGIWKWDNPVRIANQIRTLDGELIAEQDVWEESRDSNQ